MDLRPLIAKKNLTQGEIMRRLDWTRQMVQQVASGKRKVPLKHMAAFEEATGISRKVFRPELFK